MKLFFGNALWQLIMQSDVVSWIVLLILLGLSIACWTIFLYKIMVLRVKNKQLDEVTQKLSSVQSLESILELHATHAKTVPGYFIIKQLKSLEWFLETNARKGEQGITKMQADMLESNAYQIADDIIGQEEAYLPVLSTSAAVAPLLGLFGTVWGLIQAFIAIGEKQAADISAVAPGIAQALTTTLAGLLVAIPAFIMFNYVSSQVRLFEQKVSAFAERLNLVIHRLLIR